MGTISFGTDGWRALLEEFTTPRVRMVGQAVATYLQDQELEGPVAVGYDARETSRGFADELTDVLCMNGFDVLLSERDRPTPLIAHAIVDRDLAGGLVVTASHNPPEYNGVKFIPQDGAPAPSEVMDAVSDRLAEPDPLPESDHGATREVDFVSSYAEDTLEILEQTTGITDEVSNLTIAYDAMHGSGRRTTDTLLERIGASVERLRTERDPQFGGTGPEPAPQNLTELIEIVSDEGSKRGNIDLGIANDGDADRIAIITPQRGYLDENLFFAALYDFLLESTSGAAIRTVSTSYLIDRIAEANSESVHEVPVGFKWVGEAMADHDALVGGEESGGFTIRGHIREKDGVLMALLAAGMHAKEPIDSRIDRLLEEHGTVIQDKTSLACPDAQKARVLLDLEEEIPETVAETPVEGVNTADGFKLLLADGSWLLIRPSGTEPVLRVYAEATNEKRVAELLIGGKQLLKSVM